MQISLSTFFVLLAATASQAINTVAFDCKNIPNVCENMCWGTKCTETHGALATLEYDGRAKKDPVIAQRRKAAGCPSSYNRCSNSPKAKSRWPVPDFNCDEFPFASTKDSDGNTHANRCVPKKENSSQGSALQKFFAKEFPGKSGQGVRAGCQANPTNCKFNIAFQFGKKRNAAPTNSICRATRSTMATHCKNVPNSFASPMQSNTKYDDVEHDGFNGQWPNPKVWKRASDLALTAWKRAGTLAPTVWKRGGSDDGKSDAGSDTSKDSKTSGKTTASSSAGSTGSGGTDAGIGDGYQYQLGNGYYIYTNAKLAIGSTVFVMEYDETACTGGIKSYLEVSDVTTEEQVMENMDIVDEKNKKCWQMHETKVEKEVTE